MGQHGTAHHKLPKAFHQMCLPNKTWSTLSDETLLKAVSSWNWLHAYFREYRGKGVSIGASKWSKMAACLTIIRCKTSGVVYASMGNKTFAAIFLKLYQFDDNGLPHFKFHASCKVCEFAYLTDPRDWEAIPYTAIRLQGHGIVMQQHADGPMPLMRHCLRQARNPLTVDDIAKYMELLGLQLVPPHNKIGDMYLALAKHFLSAADADSVEVREEAALYKDAANRKDNADDLLLADPLVDVVYEDMNAEDKGEFREIGEAKQRKSYNTKIANWKRSRDRVFGRGRPKGSGKGQGAEAEAEAEGAKGKGKGKGGGRGGGIAEAAAEHEGAADIGLEHARARHLRHSNYGLTSNWSDIFCRQCTKENGAPTLAGQSKYSAAPGNRYGETWYIRCFDYYGNKWPKGKPGLRQKTASTFVDSNDPGPEIDRWVQQHRTCCTPAPCEPAL